MSLAADDLGVLSNLAVALGVFTPDGDPNPSWFGDPEASLETMLADDDQRNALVAFVDEAMGGADRTTDPGGVVWLPIVSLDDPDLLVAVTLDDSKPAGIDIGLGVAVNTADPASRTSLSVPLFRARHQGGPAVPSPFLLGSPAGRIRIATAITVDSTPAVPGHARLGAIGLDVDVPTSPADPVDPVFGLSLTGFQLPGATSPRDIRVAADGLDELDDAVLDLVLSMVRSAADAAASSAPIAAVAGLLGLRSGDTVPDFPITALASQGVAALTAWVLGIVTTPASHDAWLGYAAGLLGGTEAGGVVSFDLGGTADLTFQLRVDTGPTGHARLTPALGIELGSTAGRVEARADLFTIDLVTGSATAFPQLGLFAAAGRSGAGNRILDVTNPTVARADTLRVGFALDPQRRLTFTLAADGVQLGAHQYASLDLTSPDAVMDAVENTVEDIANQLLAQLGGALPIVQELIGLEPPAGVTAATLAELMTDPLGAIAAYWQRLLAGPVAAMPAVLTTVRDALANSAEAVLSVRGTGTAVDPWLVPLIGPLKLELVGGGPVLSIGLAATTRVDTLGQRCTILETRLSALLFAIDLAAGTGSLLPGVEGVLTAWERGSDPPSITLALGEGASIQAGGVGVRFGWSPGAGLGAGVAAPDLTLTTPVVTLPIELPTVAADGTVTLPPEAWTGVEVLVGYLGGLLGGVLGDVVDALGWGPAAVATVATPTAPDLGGAYLPLGLLVSDPAAALAAWLPELALSDIAPQALSLLADLLAGSGAARGVLVGTGHPDDPYRLPLPASVPTLAVWFPPAGLEPRLAAAPEALQRWRPGDPALSADALAAALTAEAAVAADVFDLVDGRDIAGGLAALAQRWIGGDGRIVPPAGDQAPITVNEGGVAVGQMAERLNLASLIGRVPDTTVYVALGATSWTDAPAERRVDLTAAGLDAPMFPAPDAAAGEWFVALGTRAGSRLAASATDGTPEQAARLRRVLDALAAVSSDIAVVAVAGAGHAARLAAGGQTAVTDVVTLGTPLGPISLTALSTQPTADALRLLHRLLPVAPGAAGVADDDDLALGRHLVAAMTELTDQADPSADLRQPVAALPVVRAGLRVTAVFGAVTAAQVGRAMTAVVAAGLAERARTRAATPLPAPTGVAAGVFASLLPTSSGTLAVAGDARLTVLSYDRVDGLDTKRHLRVRLQLTDRLGWLTATPELELRKVTADVSIPLDGTSPGEATVTLHDARVFGQSWERLVLGTGADAVPVLPEARTLLASAVQRVTSDATGVASVALDDLLTALGIIELSGGVVGDAIDQLVHDPGGLIRQRLATGGAELSEAVGALLGGAGASFDLPTRTVHIQAGDDTTGRFGWHADLTAAPSGLAGRVRLGPSSPVAPAGGLNLVVDLQPFAVRVDWHQPGGSTDTVAVWPVPDPAAIARAVAKAAPSLGGHAALELLRRADDSVRPVVDAVLDSFGLLAGTVGDQRRAIRPLAALLADPAGWLRSADSLAASPGKIQGLFDALRPLLGIGGAPGTPLALSAGVALSVVADGPGARLALDVDPTAWTAPGNAAGRLAAGVGASLLVGPSGPPSVGLEAYAGMDGAAAGRQAVHARLGTAGAEVFLRPATGADIPLLPFAGLGSLAAAAEAALPFLLDKLAALPGTPGSLVQHVGDALALRTGAPLAFDGTRLHAWAADPVAALTAAVPHLLATGLDAVAPVLDSFVPAAVVVTGTASSLTVAIATVSLGWNATTGVVTFQGNAVAVPGVDHVSFSVALSAAGVKEFSATLGPAAIDAGGVVVQPFVTVAAGLAPVGGRRVAAGLAVDGTHRFAARWLLDTHQFAFVASDGVLATAVETTDPAEVGLRLVEVVADLVASVAMAQPAVTQLLDSAVGATTVRNLLRGVVLADVASPHQLIAGLFDPATLLARVLELFGNLAGAGLSVTVDGLTLSFLAVDGVMGLQVGLAQRMALISGDVMLWLENDDSWIDPNPPGNGGLFVGLVPTAMPLSFKPSLVVNGLGLRIGKSSGALVDVGIAIESVALHAYAAFATTGPRSGGVQLQFTNLAVSTGGAGGDNGIAQGIMRDSGPQPPKPAFSPALAIQKHGNQPVEVSLRAGDGDGPWWIAIRKGFGPLYLEQIGFGVKPAHGDLERISLLIDGSVSMFGLTCTVDDLQITYIVANGDFFNPNNWAVDLAGLAVSADMGGIVIAGGLLRQETDAGIEYLGMLLARFAVYGITIYGGYGQGLDNGEKFTAFFAVGAINGPIGGPPCFFLTGIGGGFGINRALVVPTDLSNFGDFPLIQALDIAAQPQDPMAQLRSLGQYFPMKKGTFWFAAGVSFNSFALVDGIAVIAVEIGDGLDISLLGLARMALPRPQVALVSIELALLVRFSSSEGVLWIQAQLTDNSWLLYPDIKLTGGFAYVIWFKGEHKGEFVLTLGGYHPDFHRDGYPVVPRLGLRWSIGDSIVIKAGAYFALTSEALMAGGDFEASAHFGPAWAELAFGANGIVFFDPFHYHVNAYARISAGITIDTWIFGEITISISLGARIDVSGPDFHGSATFEVGPIELTVSFGGDDKAQLQPISADAFITKYLAPADGGGGAQAHAAMTSFGALPAQGDQATPDGSDARPFVVVCEFGLTFTTSVPAVTVNRTQAAPGATTQHAPSRMIGVAPMLQSNVQPALTLTWQYGGAAEPFPFVATGRPYGRFPVGVWGPAQDANNAKVPKGEMLEALNELALEARAAIAAAGPEIPYYQVEIGRRKPLPFSRRSTDISTLKSQAAAVAALVTEPTTVLGAFSAASTYLASSASPTALAALRGERQSPPLVGTLAESLDADAVTVKAGVGAKPGGKVYDYFVDPPVAVGILSGATADLRTNPPARTTVEGSAGGWRVSPPTMATVEASRSRSIAARLVTIDAPAVNTAQFRAQGLTRLPAATRAAVQTTTLIGATGLPPSAVAHAAPAVVARTGAPGADQLTGFTTSLATGRRAGRGSPGAVLQPGQTVVLKLPNAPADAALDGDRPSIGVTGSPARLVILAHGGVVLHDAVVAPDAAGAAGSQSVATGAERIVAVGLGTPRRPEAPDGSLAGWHAGLHLPYAGWSTAVAPGCVVHATSRPLRRHPERLDAGWVTAAELVAGVATVTTTFTDPVTTVVVIVDDPAAFGDPVSGRQLVLGLDGADRAVDGAGAERPPVLLTMDNRSVLAYDVVPTGDRPVVVTIASEEGWSLVGVMGSDAVTATGAVSLLSARGLDTAVRRVANGSTGASRLSWLGPTRTPKERRVARALAGGRPHPASAASSAASTGRSRPAPRASGAGTAVKSTAKATATKATRSAQLAKAAAKAGKQAAAAKKAAGGTGAGRSRGGR